MPNFRPGIYAYNPYTGQTVGYNYTAGYNLSVVSRNPYTGMVSSAYLSQQYSGPFLPPFLQRPIYYAPASYGYGYGGAVAGSGAMDPNNNPIVQEQLRILKAAGVRGNFNDIEARKFVADQLAREQRARAVANPKANAGFLNATEEQILSGNLFTEMSAAIVKLEKTGLKAESLLLTPELLAKVRYAPSDAADLLELMHEGKPTLPAFMEAREWLVVRTELTNAVTPVVEAALAGKRVEPMDAAKLTRQLKKTRLDIVPLMKDLDFADATTLNKLLTKIERLPKLTTDNQLQGVFNPARRMSGATVKEFVNHNEKYKLIIDQADPGDLEAYLALYRGLMDYHTALVEKSDEK